MRPRGRPVNSLGLVPIVAGQDRRVQARAVIPFVVAALLCLAPNRSQAQTGYFVVDAPDDGVHRAVVEGVRAAVGETGFEWDRLDDLDASLYDAALIQFVDGANALALVVVRVRVADRSRLAVEVTLVADGIVWREHDFAVYQSLSADVRQQVLVAIGDMLVGSVSVIAQEPVTVMVDGREAGSATVGSPFLSSAWVGQHEVELIAPHGSRVVTAAVRRGETTVIRYESSDGPPRVSAADASPGESGSWAPTTEPAAGYHRECLANEARGCGRLGMLLLDESWVEPGLPADRVARGCDLLRTACGGGDRLGCSLLMEHSTACDE